MTRTAEQYAAMVVRKRSGQPVMTLGTDRNGHPMFSLDKEKPTPNKYFLLFVGDEGVSKEQVEALADYYRWRGDTVYWTGELVVMPVTKAIRYAPKQIIQEMQLGRVKAESLVA